MARKQLASIKVSIARYLRRLADWLDPPKRVPVRSKLPTKTDLRRRARELWVEAERNKMSWSGPEWIEEEVFGRLYREYPYCNSTDLAHIAKEIHEQISGD